MNIGLFGYGVVGSGIHKLIKEKNLENEFNITKVFARENKKELLGSLLKTDINEILEDNTIDTIIEALGGDTLPYKIIKKALSNGINVVTSNKEVVSNHLIEFIEIAHKNNCSFLFEASVGASIPCIRKLIENSKSNEITDIYGILNGTTNFILTKMEKYNMSFNSALKLAQEKGFAEANPESDILGLDGVRKINILSSLAFNTAISNDSIYHFGIENVTEDIIKDLENMGFKLKFVCSSSKKENDIEIRVEPAIIKFDNPMAKIEDENNIVLYRSRTNKISLVGKGAGAIPTATAILSDLIAIKENRGYIAFTNENKYTINKTLNANKYYIIDSKNNKEFKTITNNDELKNVKFFARVI